MFINLNGKWKMRRTDQSDWMEGNVPGSVYNDLLVAGKMDDPFYRDNEDKIRDISYFNFEYERDFNLNGDFLECNEVVLLCKGLDTLADIHINGFLAASADNMHRTYEFDIKEHLHEGLNTIHIIFHSPLKYIEEHQKKHPLTGAHDAVAGFPHMRKGHSMFGWDWGPQLPDMGIWRDISITGYCKGRLDDVYITQAHNAGKVSLDFKTVCEIWNEKDAFEMHMEVTAPNGSKTNGNFPVNRKTDSFKLDIDNPQLWWPRGYGTQPLYRVRVSLENEGKVLDERVMNIGLRTMKVLQNKDQWGETFEFNVNGVSIFAMGADYIPEDNILARCNEVRTEKLIRDCIEANYNCIRVWGGGIYPEDYFFNICDKYGIIVWQDLMFACAEYNLTSGFAANIKKEAEDNIRRIRHHACLGLWCGNNEIETGLVSWDDWKDLKFKPDYIRQFEIILAQAAENTDPCTFYWPSSPSSGGCFDDPNDQNRGDVHYWDVWHGLKPFTDYRNYHFRFASEFGFQSFPCLKTVKTFTLPEDRNIFSYVMEKHQKNGSANGKILYYLAENFKYPKDLDSLLYASQLLQAEAIKYGVEHWRRNRGRCMGSIYWQINDCWPVASWSSIDYFGRWKALHYFAKRFYAPVLLSVLDEGIKADFYITNETREPQIGTIEWRLRNNLSEVIRKGIRKFEIPPLCAQVINNEDFSDIIEDKESARKTYLEYSLIINEKVISRESLLFVKPKHFDFLNPCLQAEVYEEPDAFVLTISAKAYAKYIELELSECDCIFSDNFFDVSSEESRTIKLLKDNISIKITEEELLRQLRIRSIYDISYRG